MPKANSKRTKFQREAQYGGEGGPVDTFYPPRHAKRATRPLEPRTERQAEYIRLIASHDVIFSLGPAGTGKTYVPVALAAQELDGRRIDKFVVTRPAVTADDEEFGFLPGELDEKYRPFLEPVEDALIERLGKGTYEAFLKEGKISPKPLAFMRGKTLKDCWVILDEAQNVTPKQMKMFLTRFGENCKFIICGDSDQVDIQDMSGLVDAQRRTKWSPRFATIEFTEDDVVRHDLVKDVLKSYRR